MPVLHTALAADLEASSLAAEMDRLQGVHHKHLEVHCHSLGVDLHMQVQLDHRKDLVALHKAEEDTQQAGSQLEEGSRLELEDSCPEEEGKHLRLGDSLALEGSRPVVVAKTSCVRVCVRVCVCGCVDGRRMIDWEV